MTLFEMIQRRDPLWLIACRLRAVRYRELMKGWNR